MSEEEKINDQSSHWRAYLAAAISGGAVLIVEIAGARLLAPYFGAGLFVWTSAISVILAALAIGYFIGSKFAQRDDLERMLSLVFTGAAIATFITPYLIYFIGDNIPRLYSGDLPSAALFLSALAASLIALMPAGLLYGMVSPLIIEIVGRSDPHPGRISGRVFAVSTVGSIVGTILVPLFFFALFGTHRTFVLVSAVILLLPVLMRFKHPFRYLFLSLFLLIFGLMTRPNPLKHDLIIDAIESPYQLIQLVRKEGKHEVVFDAGYGIQSVHYDDSPWTGNYWDWLAAIPFFQEKPAQEALVIGFAGGTVPRIWRETAAKERVGDIDAVDIDLEVFNLVEKHFSPDLFQTNKHIQDGRLFLLSNQRQYDVILLDAFAHELQIPFHLATVEHFQLVKEDLRSEGTLAFNVALGGEGRLASALSNTVAAVFPYVYRLDREDAYNTLVIARKQPLAVEKMPDFVQKAGLPVTDGFQIDRVSYQKKELIFTDDYAPVELMTGISLL